MCIIHIYIYLYIHAHIEVRQEGRAAQEAALRVAGSAAAGCTRVRGIIQYHMNIYIYIYIYVAQHRNNYLNQTTTNVAILKFNYDTITKHSASRAQRRRGASRARNINDNNNNISTTTTTATTATTSSTTTTTNNMITA